MIKNIHHIGINVRDFDRMVTFYRDAFGFKTLGAELDISADKAEEISGRRKTDAGTRVVMMQTGNCYLEIMGNPNLPTKDGTATGYTQLCVDVDDIDSEFARLGALGMAFGSKAPVDFGHVKAVTGCDPEGNAIELVQTMRDWDCNLAELLPQRA
jgi:catechol 2,3-dioxygenase-like lactoylglutathione lyase family enzyme